MALRVWLPLNGNLNNNGLSPVTVTNNGATVNDSGKIGKCYAFNGSSSYMTFGTPISLNGDHSICCWIDLTNVSSTQYFIGFASGGIRYGADNEFYYYTVTETKSWHYTKVNRFIHVAFVCGSDTLSLYVDGEQIGISRSLTSRSSLTHIGRRSDGYYYNGKLNDIRIYDHCLSPREVKEISRGLVLHYKLDDPYIEPTENLNSADWAPYQSYWTIVSQTQNEIKLRKNTSTGSTNTVALKNNVLCGKIATNQTVTISGYLYKGDTPYKTSRDKPTTYGGWTKISAYSDDTGYFRFTGYFTSAMTFDWLFHETLFGGGNQDGDICYIRNLQWEAKDHATPYTPSSRSAVPAYDCSGYGNNGTPNGTLTLSDDSPRYSKSTKFNGTNSYITFGSQVSLANDHSICCWLDLTNVSAVQYFVAFTSGGGIRYSGGDNSFLYFAGGATYTWDYTKVNRFVHVAFVCASNLLSLYVDGQLIGSRTRTVSANCTGIGSRSDGYYYNGNISDFRIYSTALSADDVKELYNTSALIHNDGTIEAFEFVETESGSPEVTKTGLVKAQSHIEQPILCEYLQADGNSWINTLIPYDSTKDTYRIECKFSQPSNVSSYDAIFGAYNDENSKCLRIIRGNSNSILWVYYNTRAGSGNPLSLSGTNGDIKEVVITSTTVKVTVGGTTSTYNIPTKVSANNMTGTFYLFSQKDSSCRSKSIIYYFRLYDGDTLLCNMVPCILNGAPGMWDIVGSKFYGNDGTGTFTTGAQQTTVTSLFANKTISSQLLES